MSWEGRGWVESVSNETSIKEQPVPPSSVRGSCPGSPLREAAHVWGVVEVPCNDSSTLRPEETLCGQLGCTPWSSCVHWPGQRRPQQTVVMPAPSWFSSLCLPTWTSRPLQAPSHPPGFFPASLPSWPQDSSASGGSPHLCCEFFTPYFPR